MSNIIEDFYYGNIEPQEVNTELTPKLKKKLNTLLPLRYPINSATLICGGILTNICIWSGMPLLLWSLLSFHCTVSLIFHLHLFLSHYILLFFCILVQILCDIHICNLSVLSFLFHFSLLKKASLIFCDLVGKPSLYIISRLFYMPRLFIHPW